MTLLERILGSIDRTPKAKRRFNLLREEPPVHPGRQRGLSVLGPFVLYASLPLAGFWQIQSDLDPLLSKSQLSGQASDLEDGNDTLLSTTVSAPPSTEGRGLVNRPKPTHLSSRRVSRRANNVQTKEQAFYRKARIYHKQKNLEMAVQLYRQVLLENPKHRDALFQLSSIYMERSAYAEAYPLLSELVSLDPRDPQALVNLAIAEIALGRPQKAIADLDRALTLSGPPRFEIYFHQGVARSKLQRFEEALIWYKKSEDLDPAHAHLLFNMAVTFDKLERYDEALDCYARFLEASGSSSPKERKDVEARIGVLMAYVAQRPGSFTGKGAH